MTGTPPPAPAPPAGPPAPGASPPPGPRVQPPAPAAALPAAAAALVHLAFDALLYPSGWTRPPHLRVEDMPEVFQQLPLVPAPVAVSVASAAVGGVLAAIALSAVEPSHPRRARLVAGLVTGLWLFTALLTWFTWLSTPFLRALPGILLGIPRGAAVGWLAARLSARGPARRPA